MPFLWKRHLKVVSLHLEMQLAITSTSGTEKGRHLPTTSYTVMLLPVSFHCLLVHRSSTSYTLCPKFLAPSIPDKTAFSTSGAHFFYLPMGIARSCLHIGWILVQALTSCSGSAFYPQFHGNLWHFQDVTSTFFTSGKATSAATIHLAVKFIHHPCLSLVFPFHNQRESQCIYLGNGTVPLVTRVRSFVPKHQ